MSSTPIPSSSFESAMSELDTLVAQIEDGALPLAELLSTYQRGASLLAFCKEQLQSVENQVQLLEQQETSPWKS